MRHRLRDRLGMGRVNRIRRTLAPAVAWNLTLLGKLYGTDKAGSTHPYTRFYGRHLASLRRRPINLLEIGIGGYSSEEGGASLRMWRSYFPLAKIHGLDIAEKRLGEPRIMTHRGSQADADLLRRLGIEYGPFDVIIDDGSHRSDDVVASFEALFTDHCRPGGWYVIEDLATAYLADFGGGPPGFSDSSTTFIAQFVDDINVDHWGEEPRWPWPVDELHVYDQIAFIRRR